MSQKAIQDLNKNQQLQFQQIIDSIDANIYWKDKNGNYLGCNQSVLNNLELNNKEDIIGKNDYESKFPWNKSAFAIQINRPVPE